MILNLEETKDLYEWLQEKGLFLQEATDVILDIQQGYSLSAAFQRMLDTRKKLAQEWDANILTP